MLVLYFALFIRAIVLALPRSLNARANYQATISPAHPSPELGHDHNAHVSPVLVITDETLPMMRRDDGPQTCVQYAQDSPSNVQDVIQWFTIWSSNRSGYLPKVLQDEFAIPKEAFDCPGPDEKGDTPACQVATDNYCFTGKGDQDDIANAWAVLNLIARYRVSRTVLESMYTATMIPPEGDEYGNGIVMDYAKLMKDFYNGAMGDSPIPVSDLMNLVASIFLFTPFGIANSKTHFNANLAALQAAEGKAFQGCTWYSLASSKDCLKKPGFNAVWGEMNKLHRDFDQNLNWVDVITDISTLSLALKPDYNLVMAGYKDFLGVFQRAIWMQLQKQQDVFFHVQKYDLDTADDPSYWGVTCSTVISDITGGACKDTSASPDDHQSIAYYPVQLTAQNGSISRDYTAFNAVADYGWNPHVILGQSHRCADLKSQSYDLKPAFPQIFDAIRSQDTATAWINSVDRTNLDFIDCLWSLPMMEFSEGPNYNGMSKAEDTLKNDAAAFFGADSLGMNNRSPRGQWKFDNPRDYQVWKYIRDDGTYCPYAAGRPGGVLLGWGIVENDDQFLADVFAAQQIVLPNTDASSALEQLHQAACIRQQEDTGDILFKEALDFLINIAATAIAPGFGSAIVSLLSMAATAAVSQTLADDEFLQPWIDNKIRQQFTLDGDAQTAVGDHLAPFFKTQKVGEGIS